MNRFSQVCLALIVGLLAVIAFRLNPPTVHAAIATAYKYEVVVSDRTGYSSNDAWLETREFLDKNMGEWELVSAIALQGERNDNISTGTHKVVFVFRKPK